MPRSTKPEFTDTIHLQPPPRNHKILNALISVFSVLLIIIALVGVSGFFLVYLPARTLLTQTMDLKNEGLKLQAAVSSKDLNLAKIELVNVRSKLNLVENSFHKFNYLSKLPYLKDYYHDGQAIFVVAHNGLDAADIVVQAIEPYQDFLGLKGSSTSATETTSDRITFLTNSIASLVPHFDTLDLKMTNIEQSLSSIDPNRYPDEFHGIQIRSGLLQATSLVSQAHQLLTNAQPILAKTSWMLGKDSPRNYLLLFQNNAELRPTGGFWTAFSLIQVDQGKIHPVFSDDIYTLDAKVNSHLPAPRPIKAYHINASYWYVRDMNISPDFPTSVSLFLKYYYQAYSAKPNVDAVIAIDPQVLVDIVKIIGRIGVSGYGNFDATPDKRCDGCPQIIYQLEWLSGQPRNYIDLNRKGFLGPLMNSVLGNVMAAQKSMLGPLVESAFNDIYQKHILFYFTDPSLQSAATLANITGNITQTDAKTDFLHINDANMDSAKTNLFLTENIKHEIRNNNGKVEHKITITYTNPSRASNCNLEKGSLCLNAAEYRDWFRFYVPTGSTLEKMTGSEVDPVQYQELNKQVFEGFFGNKYPLYAQNSSRVTIQYFSSIPASTNYNLLLQKQPGTKPINYELWVNGIKTDTFSWVGDKTIKLSL